MIDKNKIIQCIQDFNGLDSNTLTDLQMTVEKYPYFQTAKLLYFINLYKENNQLYNTQLKFAAAYASDRTLLHKLVNDFNNQKKPNSVEQKIINDNKFAIQNQEIKIVKEEI